METLNRIYKNSRNLVGAPSKDIERRRMKIFESQAVGD
jgi:hypothetical protein